MTSLHGAVQQLGRSRAEVLGQERQGRVARQVALAGYGRKERARSRVKTMAHWVLQRELYWYGVPSLDMEAILYVPVGVATTERPGVSGRAFWRWYG